MLTTSRIAFCFLFLSILVFTSVMFYNVGANKKSQDIVYVELQNKATTKIAVNAEYLRCMATNIYHEAASEPFMGQVMVARVVMNRIKHGFAQNPCAVIYAKHEIKQEDGEDTTICQFSWVCEDKQTPLRNAQYKQAEEIAKRVLTENAWSDIVPSNVLFFHNSSVNPKWPYQKVATIGNHTFYAKNSNNKQ